MGTLLQQCKVCQKRMAEVLMIKVDDHNDDGYSWICPGHNVKAPGLLKRVINFMKRG